MSEECTTTTSGSTSRATKYCQQSILGYLTPKKEKMMDTNDTTTSSYQPGFNSLPGTRKGAIGDQQAVTLATSRQQTPVEIVKTAFGSLQTSMQDISIMPSAICTEKKAVKRTVSSTTETQENSSPSETPPKKTKKECMEVQLTELCCKYNLISPQEFHDAVQTNEEVKMFKRYWGAHRYFKTALMGSTDIAYGEHPNLTFEERVEAVEDGYGDKFNAAVDQWKQFITSVMSVQTFGMIFQVMNMQLEKRKSVYMVGEASGGKSAIIRLLTSVYRYAEIGKAGSQGINSNFWLEDLVNKRIAVLDEIVATQVNVDALKMLMEGNDFTHTNAKYEKSYQIKAMPVLIACNHDICRQVQAHWSAIMARCVEIKFTKSTNFKLYYDLPLMRQILKKLYYDIVYNSQIAIPRTYVKPVVKKRTIEEIKNDLEYVEQQMDEFAECEYKMNELDKKHKDLTDELHLLEIELSFAELDK